MSNYRELILILLEEQTNLVDDENNHESKFLAEKIKGMATILKDVEVIGHATLLENRSIESIQDEYEVLDQLGDYNNDFFDRNDQVRELCIKVFYKDKLFSPDMSSYRNLVEENKEALVKADRYEKLSRYIDEKKVLDKIYNKMKNDLLPSYGENETSKVPDEEYIKEQYPSYLSEIYRLANNHVKSEIEKSNYKLVEE